MAAEQSELKHTPLFEFHRELGARMVPFAGYAMPVQYEGIIAEHKWTREKAGLFDVSHMGQRFLIGPDHATTAAALERLAPGDFSALKPGRQRYTLLLLEDGGILDDVMVARSPAREDDGSLFLVFNAARRQIDDAHIAERLPEDVMLTAADDRALLALQGPAAHDVMARHCPEAAALSFMQATAAAFALPGGGSVDIHVSRSGYTGEDGFEISLAGERAQELADALIAQEEVRPVGLGARDSLRLEAGLPLYGHDIDETTSPVEAGLAFAIARTRRERADFPGAGRILSELREGPPRLRVGLRPSGRAPVREGARILGEAGSEIGGVTSGGFAPSLGAPVAMGYVAAASAAPGTGVRLSGRRGAEPAEIVPLPFVPHRYRRQA